MPFKATGKLVLFLNLQHKPHHECEQFPPNVALKLFWGLGLWFWCRVCYNTCVCVLPLRPAEAWAVPVDGGWTGVDGYSLVE